MEKIAIASPVYNEAQNVKKLIPAVARICEELGDLSFTLLLIDDNSPDGTGKIALETAKHVKVKNLKVRVLHRKKKDGFGRAYVAGFNELFKQDFDYIIQMDADLSHDPKYLKDFIREAQAGRDFVVGSRYVKGGGTPDWDLHRKILSRGGNIYTRFWLSRRLSDYTGGYNMYSTDLLKSIDTSTLASGGYGFLIELKYKALLKAKSFAQVPIIFHDRQHGVSKLPKNTLAKNLLLVPRLRVSKLKDSQ